MGNWGAIAEGYDEYGPFSASQAGPSHGVRCKTRSGVVYQGPPPGPTGLRGWEQVPTDRLRYVLPLDDEPTEPENQTIGELAASLRAGQERGRGSGRLARE